jgi:hypothetical protein
MSAMRCPLGGFVQNISMVLLSALYIRNVNAALNAVAHERRAD